MSPLGGLSPWRGGGLWCDDDYEELDKEDGIIKRDDKIVRYYLINEGCELLEVEKIG